MPTATADSDPRTRAVRLLLAHGAEGAELRESAGDRRGDDVLATALMDLFRRSNSSDVFEALVALSRPTLMRRVRTRVRFLGTRLDPHEVLQDAYVNIFRYPDKFDGSRSGAFRAWSSTIVDNTIRRHLRRARSGPEVHLRPVELLCREADVLTREPGTRAIQAEDCENALRAMMVVLSGYLEAYHALTERERFVLQMVEVKGLRYAQLAEILHIRPEALKMVVFRARRRIFERVSEMFCRFDLQAAG